MQPISRRVRARELLLVLPACHSRGQRKRTRRPHAARASGIDAFRRGLRVAQWLVIARRQRPRACHALVECDLSPPGGLGVHVQPVSRISPRSQVEHDDRVGRGSNVPRRRESTKEAECATHGPAWQSLPPQVDVSVCRHAAMVIAPAADHGDVCCSPSVVLSRPGLKFSAHGQVGGRIQRPERSCSVRQASCNVRRRPQVHHIKPGNAVGDATEQRKWRP